MTVALEQYNGIPGKDTQPALEDLGLPEELTDADKAGLSFLVSHPNIAVDLYLSDHGKAEDLGPGDDFEQKVAAADIYGIEGIGTSSGTERRLGGVATGSVFGRIATPYYKAVNRSFNRRAVRAIQNSHTVPVVVDPTANHPFHKHHRQYLALSNATIAHAEAGDIAAARASAQEFARLNNVREWAGLARLGASIQRATETDPALADKLQAGDLSVFMTYGVYHTTMINKLRKLGLSPTYTVQGIQNAESLTFGTPGMQLMHDEAAAIEGGGFYKQEPPAA